MTFTSYGAEHLIFDLSGEYVTETGTAGSVAPSSVRAGHRESLSRSPFSGLDAKALVNSSPDAASTRAAAMTSDGVVHSFGQADVDLPVASTIKALVLGCTLLGLQDRGATRPDPAMNDLLHLMISVSDNNATTTLPRRHPRRHRGHDHPATPPAGDHRRERVAAAGGAEPSTDWTNPSCDACERC